ncbi:HNH endonuclease [Mucilaginibacter phyllosphaerae]
MTYWLISANSQLYDHSSSFEHHSFIDWRQGKGKFKVNDIVFIYTTSPTSIIEYKCVVEMIDLLSPNNRNDEEYWKNKNEYHKSINGKFMRLRLLGQLYNPKLSLSYLKKNGLNAAPQGPLKIKPQLLNYINENFSEHFLSEFYPDMIGFTPIAFEGLKKQILVNKYERSSTARKRCIEYNGLECKICLMNFCEIYGDIGKDFIHVHHLVPMHEVGKEYKVDYKNDLIPVCPNCHSMLHRKVNGKEPSIDELRMLLNAKKFASNK